jgi:nucleoside-diphosphate-sugar epimerase
VIAVVTGAAGFIGSHLCEALLNGGYEVRGVDAFTDYYPRDQKEQNLAAVAKRRGFSLVEADLTEAPLQSILSGADVVFHLAGQPGVRPSWGSEFAVYVRHNILSTQRLLEACKRVPLRKLVYASSSSVYGDAETYPTPETLLPRPVSPYGVTKLAGENLCELYRINLGIPTVSLRLFTVYGPRQRPDMAFSRLVRAAVLGTEFELFGDGEQTRDFTYVADVVRVMQDASRSDWCGVANVGGGARTSLNEILATVRALCGPVRVRRSSRVRGDASHTAADTRLAASAFGYSPRTSTVDGLRSMVAWQRERLEALAQ